MLNEEISHHFLIEYPGAFEQVPDAVFYCRTVGTATKDSRYGKYLHNNPVTSEDNRKKTVCQIQKKAFRGRKGYKRCLNKDKVSDRT